MRLRSLAAIAATMLASGADATTVRIHYDAGKETILVRADKGPISWSKGVRARAGADKVWTYTWPDKLGMVTMKPTLGADKVSTGGAYRIAAGATRDIYPFFGAATGTVTVGPEIASPQLDNSRKLRIYLPPSYNENRAKRYPVLYMHDGQNLFDASTAAYGVEWSVDETADRLIAAGAMEEIIAVGIDNTPDRIAEYTPCCDPRHGGGKLDAYQAFVTGTVKPHIDRTLRTLPGRETSAIMGSSLGAIASLLIAQRQPQVFSKSGGVSSSLWWNDASMVNKPAPRVPVKFYLDAGTDNDGLEETQRMRDVMLTLGYRLESDLRFHAAEGGAHNEKSWAARLDKPLVWFFPWDRAKQ